MEAYMAKLKLKEMYPDPGDILLRGKILNQNKNGGKVHSEKKCIMYYILFYAL